MHLFQALSLVLGVYCGLLLAEICPPDWHQYGESCYFIIMDKIDWYDANRTCAESGATLVIPNSQPEQDYVWELFLNEFDQTPDMDIWIACNDIEEEGNWQHCPLKAEINVYSNWADHEPGSSPVANCGHMWYDVNGKWDDIRCTRRVERYAVCERHVKPTADINGRLTPQCLLHHAMEKLMGDGVVSCGKSRRSHPRCHSFNLLEQDCPPSNKTTQ